MSSADSRVVRAHAFGKWHRGFWPSSSTSPTHYPVRGQVGGLLSWIIIQASWTIIMRSIKSDCSLSPAKEAASETWLQCWVDRDLQNVHKVSGENRQSHWRLDSELANLTLLRESITPCRNSIGSCLLLDLAGVRSVSCGNSLASRTCSSLGKTKGAATEVYPPFTQGCAHAQGWCGCPWYK